jgi:hypothetical protein
VEIRKYYQLKISKNLAALEKLNDRGIQIGLVENISIDASRT